MAALHQVGNGRMINNHRRILMMGRELRIFLSHSGIDTDAACDLKRRLLASPDAKTAGLKVWFDKDDLRPGKRWQPQIEQAIGDAAAFVVYVGSRGVINWVDIEVRTALLRAATDKNFLFIPVLATAAAANTLPAFAKLYQGVHDPLANTEELAKLLKAVLDADWDRSAKLIDEPFVGLRSMREEEADRFFGREAEVKELVDKFRKHRVVAVVADSGTGKSSLARAGFGPAFRGGALIDPAREEARDKIWQVVAMRPRADPAEGLRDGVESAAHKLGRTLTDIGSLRDSVSLADAGKTAFALRCGLQPDRTSTLLIVDQLEELFIATSDQNAAAFAALLPALAGGPSDIRILITVRSDYFNLLSGVKDVAGRAALFERLTANNNDAILRFKAMSPAGLRDAVLEPLKLAGETNETTLADAVQTDISRQASDLPLLQVALRAAWRQHHPNGPPMLECYQTVGRVSGALANEADMALKRLPPDDQARLESVFVRLVELGDTGGATQLGASLDDFDPPRRALLQKLGEDEYGQLVSVGAIHAELAHEAIITQWPWLQDMLRTNAVDVRRLARLMERTKEWSTAPEGRKTEYLATGAEREAFHNLKERHGDWLSKADRDFVAASERAYQDDLNAKRADAEARQREKDAEQARKLADARTITRRTRIGGGVALVFAIAAGAFAWYAQSERGVADQKTAEANARTVDAIEAKQEADKAAQVAEEQKAETQRQLNRANQAIAESINNDLGLQPGRGLTRRQRQALWQLATADEPVRSRFVSILTGRPGEAVHAAPEFAQISRALGLVWPSAAEVEPLIAAAVVGLQSNQSEDAALVGEFKVLVPKLSEAQAGKAVDPVLKQIGQATDPDALQALAQTLQALPVELSDAQAGQAVEPVLKQIGQAIKPFRYNAVRTLVEALQALAPKLSEAQAGQAVDPVLKQIGQTTDPDALQGLAHALQALAPKLSEAQAGQAVDPVLKQIGQTTDPDALQALAQALQALPMKLSDAQARQALDSVLTQIGQKHDPDTALAEALEALRMKLSDAQAGQAVEPVLKQIGQTTDPGALQILAQALQALAPKLSEARAGQAVDPVLKQIGQTTDPNALHDLAQALQALPMKLSEAQARQALDPVLKQIGQATDPNAVQALADALQALRMKLSEARAGQAVERVLKQIGQTTDPNALQALAQALQALALKLTEAQASQALDPVLKQIGQATDSDALQTLAEALRALAPKLSDAQASQVVERVLKQIDQTTDSFALYELGQALQALAPKLTEAQADKAVDPVLKQIGQTTDPNALYELAQALQALAPKLSEAQAGQALGPVLKQIGQTTDLNAFQALAQALQALAPKLSEAQASQALDPVVKKIGQTTDGARADAEALKALARALQALAPKLSEAHASQAIEPLLRQIGQTTDAETLKALAQALQAVAVKLSETQAGQAVDPVLKQIGQTTDPDALQALAQALQALAPKLSEAPAAKASRGAASSLAWAATDDEAAEWAQALAALTYQASNQDEILAAAIAYPAAVGQATERLLDAIRARRPDAPASKEGTEAALKWLAKTYPDVLRPPICPPPLQEQSDLKCPSSARQQD